MRRVAIGFLLLLGGFGVWAPSSGVAAHSANGQRHQLVVGAILDLSAGWTTLGRGSRVMLQLAADDANAALAHGRAPFRVRLRVLDSRGEPALALRELRQFAAAGVHVVIGPQSSSEVAALRKAAAQLGVVVISQGSTAGSLAIARDNVLRFVPDDAREGAAVVALLRHDGIDAIVPVWRDDAGNAGLARSVRRQFLAAGGKVAAGVRYSTTTTAYGAVASSVGRQVAQLRSAGGRNVGVYLAGFEEVAGLFHAAQRDLTLRVPWYGSDGVALTRPLLKDRSAAAFAHEVGYPNPTFGLSDALLRRDRVLIARAHKRLGRDPSAFALVAYDALRIVVEATQRSGADHGTRLRRAIVAAANAHDGATGRMKLNQAGDRAYGNYDFWSVCPIGTSYQWVRTFQYIARGQRLDQIVTGAHC